MQINNQKLNKFRRTIHPEETVEIVKLGLKKLGLKESVVSAKNSDELWTARIEIPLLRFASNGKGTSELAALASAYAEIAERISAGMENGIKIGPHRNLYGEKGDTLGYIIQYKYMPGYKWAHQDSIQNPVRAEELLREHRFTKGQFEHLKFNSEMLKHWIPGYSLVHNKVVYVPILFVKWTSSTNGLAAGNTIEEAIVHGACEIFERDAMIKYLRFMTKKEVPNIDLSSIEDPTINKILKFFTDNNVDVVVKDIGQGIYPVYGVITFNNNISPKSLGYNMFKAGSSFNSIEALTRCFTERMQGTQFSYEAQQGTIEEQSNPDKHMIMFFSGQCPMNLTRFSEAKTTLPFEHTSIDYTGEEIEACIRIAKKLNTDLIFIDHTHPVLDFPTARVIMPGISDFIKWWDPTKVTLDLLGCLESEEDKYEDTLMRVLRSFESKKFSGPAAKNTSRRDT